jgi:hypothetical protein
MHGGKAILLFVGAALVVVTGVFLFVPALRPGVVQGWYNKSRGFTPAKSPNDALDKFEQAIEKRDYQAASLYVSGDYKEWFDKGIKDAEPIAKEIDNLRAAMKNNSVQSDKGQFVLFLLDPFPANFKFEVKESSDTATATIHWTEELTNYPGQNFQTINGWQVDNRILNSLLPRVAALGAIVVSLKKESDGFWRIQFSVQIGERKVANTVDYLRKNGGNFKNALQSVKNDVKNNPTTKENFENALKVGLEQSK